MSTHTPGPWHWGHDGEAAELCSEEGYVTEPPITCTTSDWIGFDQDASALLIAAAPDLLAVARVAVTWYEHPAMHDAFRNDEVLYARLNDAIRLARAAIAKTK